jgi:hypothetical protein
MYRCMCLAWCLHAATPYQHINSETLVRSNSKHVTGRAVQSVPLAALTYQLSFWGQRVISVIYSSRGSDRQVVSFTPSTAGK